MFSATIWEEKREEQQQTCSLKKFYKDKGQNTPKISHRHMNALEKAWESYGNVGLFRV